MRNPNQINGRVSSYGFASVSTVKNSDFQEGTQTNGVFVGFVLNSKLYAVVDSPINASVKEDSMFSDKVNFEFKTPLGSLMLNSFTTCVRSCKMICLKRIIKNRVI